MHLPRRIAVVLAVALGATVFATTAAAARPVKTPFSNVSFSSTLSGVCSFDVNVDSVVSGFEIDYFDSTGNITMAVFHQTEQDTFTANGKTLTGIPFTFMLHLGFDSSGDVTSIVSTGVTEKVPLPDGTSFISAGYVDAADHPGATYILSPDRGNPGNVAGFCAALSP